MEVTTVKKVEKIDDVEVPFKFDGTSALNTLLIVVPKARCWPSAGLTYL